MTSHKLVILWGGMRGAVSLALALAVTENEAIPPEIRRFVAILTTGFVLFTLLVNAPTLRSMMRALGLDRLSPEEQALRDRALALARAEVADGIGEVAREHGIENALPSVATGQVDSVAGDAGLPSAIRIYSGLAILAEREQELCRERFESHTVSRRVLADLLARTGRLSDSIKAGGRDGYLAAAAHGLEFRRRFRLALSAQRWLGIDALLSQALADRLEMLLTLRLVLRELVRFEGGKVRPLLGEATGAVLHEVLSSRLGEVERSIAAIKLQYPSYAEALECQILALSALRLEEQSIVRLREDSILSQEVFNGLARELAVRRRVQERRPRLDLGLDRRQLIDRVTLFGGISAVSRVEIERLMRPRLVMPGERIVRKGDRGDGMYFISSGAVEVRVAAPVRLGNGDFFGEMALIDDRPRNADVDALGFCQLLFLARRDFDRLLEREPVLRAHIHDRASARRRA